MAGTSALLKSAANVRDQIANYQDQVMAYEYGNSAYTDSAFGGYANYLKSRIAQLGTSGSIANASKALTLTKALDSATKQNISASIQRENIQVLSGNATLTDKYNVVAQQFVRAQANGDMTLAQTLEGQAYSLSQTIQQQQQQAADAAVTLAKANASSKAASETGIVSMMHQSLNDLNNTLKNTGQKDFNKVVTSWVNSNQSAFNALGVHLQPGQQPNYFDIVHGVMGAIYNHEMLAYQALAPTNPYEAQQHYDSAMNLMNGVSTIKTLGGDMTAQQVQEAAANPSMYAIDQSTGGFKKTEASGYRYNPAQPFNPQQTYNGNVAQVTVLTPDQLTQMNKLGLAFSSSKNKQTDGLEVQATSATPQWLQKVLGPNGVSNMFTDTNTGNLTFKASSESTSGNAIYTVAKDGTAWESSATGDKLINGVVPNGGMQQQPHSVFGQIGQNFVNGMKSVMSLFASGKAYADGLPSNMLSQATSHYTLPPIPVAKPVQLPNLTVAAPQPQAALTVAKQPAIPTIQPPTMNPQQTAPSTSVQGGVGLSVQGSGMSLQGSGGIRLQ